MFLKDVRCQHCKRNNCIKIPVITWDEYLCIYCGAVYYKYKAYEPALGIDLKPKRLQSQHKHLQWKK